MQRLVERVSQLRLAPQLISLFIAIAFALIANGIAVRFAQQYHSFAMYYPDSSVYRQQAAIMYQTRQTEGVAAAFSQALAAKDGLDIALRVVFFPEMLRQRFGHVVVVLPFMAAFIVLTIWYVFSRTRSLLSGAVTAAFLFTSGFVYGPYAGIADYWKDSLGAWLLGAACVAWLLCENLKRWKWAVCCSCLLGLLVMQRTGAAVYAAPLFGLLFVGAVYKRIRQDGWKNALWRATIFATPALILVGIVLWFQIKALYVYYFQAGYAYGSMAFIAGSLIESLRAYAGLIIYLIPLGCLVCILSMTAWRRQLGDLLTGFWFLAGFPALIIVSRSSYLPGFYACWVVLLVVFLATAIPHVLAEQYRKLLIVIMSIIVLVGSLAQYQSALIKLERPDPVAQQTRDFYMRVAQIIVSQPAPQAYKLIFYESGTDFWNLLYFDVNRDAAVNTHEAPAFFSVHDSYYQLAFGNQSAEQIANQNIARLEQSAGTLVVADCEPHTLLKRTWFAANPSVEYLKNGNPLAADIAIRMGEHVRASDHWQALNRLDSPFGCMYVYRYSPQPLTVAEKWATISFSGRLASLPVALGFGSALRLYDYQSQYPPEQVNGSYYQWLPSGRDGLQLMLFAAQPISVLLQAQVLPGPSRGDQHRTLTIVHDSGEAKVQVDHEMQLAYRLDLHAGLNRVELFVPETSDRTPAPNGDSRELMLLLLDPHLAHVDQ